MILSAAGALAGFGAFFWAIAVRGLPGIAIGAAFGAAAILPAAWWLWHELRERRAAVDPEAPAALLDRRWRFIAPISVVLLALGAVLSAALPDPAARQAPEQEETSPRRNPPKPSSTSKAKTQPRSKTGPEKTSTSSSTESSTSEDTSTSTSSSGSGPTGSTSPDPTTSPTGEPTSEPTATSQTTATSQPTATSQTTASSQPTDAR